MGSDSSTIQNVSDTAFWVAFYRAVESEKQNALFQDPLASLLTGERGKKISHSMKSVGRYAYWSVIIRTCVIDAYIHEYISQGYKTIINLGAGLDTRPYRLSLPKEVQWIEIDFPEIIAYKEDMLKGHQPNCKLERIGLNLSDHNERKKLFDELNLRISPAIILTEGVIPYLDETAVASLARDIKSQSNFELWISEYYSPETYARYQSPKFKKRLGGSPFQFFPSDWFSFFKEHGWERKEIRYLYDEAQKHSRQFPLPWWVSLLALIFGKDEVMKNVKNLSAYLVFEKIE